MGEQTVATLSHFILAMVQHPWILKRAQAEIDAVVGQNRLPVLDDRPSLPYCNAIFTETLRWSVGVPLGVYPPVSSILMLTCRRTSPQIDGGRRLQWRLHTQGVTRTSAHSSFCVHSIYPIG